jgi:SARP family transcriptional regulator, regulator of embCAB operon
LPLRVYLTGNVAIEDGPVLVPERALPGRQGRLLLAVLTWQREAAIPTEELADVLWDGSPPGAWQTALRSLASKLRAALEGRATIEHAFGCYQLRLPADAWVDVEAASEAVHDAETSLRDGQLERAMGTALVANAIARRPFLAGDPTAWSERRRDDLRGLRVRALEVRGRVALANGDPTGAARDAQIVVELEPYRETAHVLLMRALAAGGNPAQALAEYERLRVRLADELGTDPSPETHAVFLELLDAPSRSR